MKATLGVVLFLAFGAAHAQEAAEALDPQTCISYMERALTASYMDSSGFQPDQPDWRGIRDDATRCGAWHAQHIEPPQKRELFAKAYATYLSGIAAPSMNVVATFGGQSIAFTTAR